LFARTECMKTVVFAACRREGVVVAPVGITNNMTVCLCQCQLNLKVDCC
jgi:hypothetical protein